jgi:hypothetical protein
MLPSNFRHGEVPAKNSVSFEESVPFSTGFLGEEEAKLRYGGSDKILN